MWHLKILKTQRFCSCVQFFVLLLVAISDKYTNLVCSYSMLSLISTFHRDVRSELRKNQTYSCALLFSYLEFSIFVSIFRLFFFQFLYVCCWCRNHQKLRNACSLCKDLVLEDRNVQKCSPFSLFCPVSWKYYCYCESVFNSKRYVFFLFLFCLMLGGENGSVKKTE